MIAGLYLAQSVSVDVLCRQHQPEGTGWMLRDDSKTRVIGLELREQTALWLRRPHSTPTLTDGADIICHP